MAEVSPSGAFAIPAETSPAFRYFSPMPISALPIALTQLPNR
jgi:hypothetical protein